MAINATQIQHLVNRKRYQQDPNLFTFGISDDGKITSKVSGNLSKTTSSFRISGDLGNRSYRVIEEAEVKHLF